MVSRKKLIIIGFAVVDVIAIVILMVLLILKANRNVVLDISLTPSKAKISINGTEYMSGAYKTYPNEKVEAVISMEGFVSKTIEVELKANETTRIHEYLMPDESNLNYYAQNLGEAENLKLFKDDQVQELLKILSIKEILPITSSENETLGKIVINEFFGCDWYFCLAVTGNFEDKGQVDTLIEQKGYNPKDYKIRYEER